MTQPTGPDRDVEQAKTLLKEYCFDLGGYQAGELVAIWQERLEAEPSWIRAAVVEALYQGRYKAFSVEQILRVWKRRGHPLRHFNSEFERVVFGPVDPTASKYAPMTTLRPSELLTSQSETWSDRADSPPALPTPIPTAAPTPPVANPEPLDEPAAPPETVLPPPQAETPTQRQLFPAPAPIPCATPITQPASFSQPEPIRKFVPPPESSEFYHRLQSVARHPFQG